jgi:hypothetical protein
MDQSIAEVQTTVISKLGTLGIFETVYDGPRSQYAGYPSAVVRPTGFSGKRIDSHRIERTIEIEVDIVQEVSEQGRSASEALAVATDCADGVIEAFDQDFDLGGKVEGTQVTAGTIGSSPTPGVQVVAVLKIEAIIIVPNHT